MTTNRKLLISMPEIAELAGVQRPVVTVWRRRHQSSFPRPVGGDSSRPMFDARAIVDWLVETGRAVREVMEPDLQQHVLWQLGSQLKPRELIASATALICLRRLDDDDPLHSDDGTKRSVICRARRVDPTDLLLRSEIEALPDHAAWLIEAVDDLVEAAWGARPAFERLLAARMRLDVPTLYRDAMAPELTRLIGAVSGASDRAAVVGTVAVADPWAGTGDLMTAVVAAIGEHGRPTICAVTSTDYLSRLLRRRLTVWDLPSGVAEVYVGSALPAHTPWDVLVTVLPYRAQENRNREQQLAYLNHLASRLGRGQCAVVVTPADLVDHQMSATAAGIRSDLLRTGAVEAAITLPEGLMPFRPGYRIALWVLHHDESGRGQGRTLVADVSDRQLTASVVDELVVDVATWRRAGFHPAAHRRAFATPARVADLIDEHGSFARRREPDLPEAVTLRHSRVAYLLDLQARISELDQQPHPTLRQANISAREGDARVSMTLGALIRQRHVKRGQGTRIAADHIMGAGHHRVIGVAELSGQLRPGQRTMDRVVLAEHYPRARLTEPGDVIVAKAPSVAAYVDDDGFSVVEFPAVPLRVTGTRRLLTARTLAALICAAPGGRAPGALHGARLDQLLIPTLEPDEVEALD